MARGTTRTGTPPCEMRRWGGSHTPPQKDPSSQRCRGRDRTDEQVAAAGQGGRTGFLNLQDSYDGRTTELVVVGDGQAIVRVDDLGG